MPDPRLPSSALAAPHIDSAAHDRCVRCGRPTPLGVSMCEACNPGRIGAPSATQLHGTIVLGVGIGLLLLGVLARTLLSGVGPFDARVIGQALRADGGVDVGVQVTNRGTKESTATCHVWRGSGVQPDDLFFLTNPIAAGATAVFERVVPPPGAGGSPYVLGQLGAACR